MRSAVVIASVSTFGVRENAHWKFFRHRYLKNMGCYNYIDTEPIN